MRLIKSIYYAWRRHKMRKEAQLELSEAMFNDPKKYAQAAKDINCIIRGHKWVSEFDPNQEIRKPLNKRVYCKNCGTYYHKHEYHNEQK